MDDTFWKQRWREGRIGFHEGRPNAFLARHAEVYASARHVLVPLCGKSEDLAFLAARGVSVTGVELVPTAAEAFFEEHQLVPRRSRQGAFERFEAGRIAILVGDIFNLEPSGGHPFDALYDRAAMIALPDHLRVRYGALLRAVLQPRTVGLVITLDYPQDLHAGPPFAVPEHELRGHFRGFDITLLEAQPWSPSEPVLAGRQCCYQLTRS